MLPWCLPSAAAGLAARQAGVHQAARERILAVLQQAAAGMQGAWQAGRERLKLQVGGWVGMGHK